MFDQIESKTDYTFRNLNDIKMLLLIFIDEKHSDSKMCTSGASSRDSSPNPKSNSTVALNGVQDSKSPSDKNKSQTMPAGEKPEKPKKKSKLSFLSRKKKPEVA